MKDKNDDILELSPEELAEIEDDEDYEECDDDGSVSEIISQTRPIRKGRTTSAELKHDVSFDEKGNIVKESVCFLAAGVDDQRAERRYGIHRHRRSGGTETLDKSYRVSWNRTCQTPRRTPMIMMIPLI